MERLHDWNSAGSSEAARAVTGGEVEIGLVQAHNNERQGFVMMGGTPMKAVTRLSDCGLNLVPIDPQIAGPRHLQFPYLLPGIVPEGASGSNPETPTIAVRALMVVSASLDEDLVYPVTSALWSARPRALLGNGHRQGRTITIQTALVSRSIPLHPGAQRFYCTKGLPLQESPSL